MPFLRADLRISEGQRSEFCHNGFVLLRDVLPCEVMKNIEGTARKLVTQAAVNIRHGNDGHVLSYSVVTGELIRRRFPELFALYTDPEMRNCVCRITGNQRVYLSRNLRSAVNINCMCESGQIYRWHFDAIPYTAVLFLTTSTAADGGALEIAVHNVDRGNQSPANGPDFAILPRAGTMLIMDGTRCLHRAAPLLRDTMRLTVPMVYPLIADDSRPDGLDEYVYDGSSDQQAVTNDADVAHLRSSAKERPCRFRQGFA